MTKKKNKDLIKYKMQKIEPKDKIKLIKIKINLLVIKKIKTMLLMTGLKLSIIKKN